jgi:hypothetical protein
MQYQIKGYLFGEVCDDCTVPLKGARIRFYLPDDKQMTARLAASTKSTYSFREEPNAGADSMVGEAAVGEGGYYECDLDEKMYKEGPLQAELLLEASPEGGKLSSPVQVAITVMQPGWRQVETGFAAVWSCTIPRRFFCSMLARADLWVICGHVTVCKTGEPIQGVRVFAKDVDWIQHDSLGSGLTDADGKFLIFYTSADFKKTPFPSVSWEMIGGPDLYFRVESSSGTALLSEPPSRGRKKDRENAGPCFCVNLCLSEQPEPPEQHTPSLFTEVGHYDVDTDFNPDGLSDKASETGNYAFTGTLSLRGILPNGYDSEAMEYRFLWAEYQPDGTLGAWKPVTADMIAETHIGYLEEWKNTSSGWKIKKRNYWANKASAALNRTVDPQGWIEVPTEDNLGAPGAPGVGLFTPSTWMIKLKSRKLTFEQFDLTSGTVHKAGEPVPPSKKAGIHTFSLRFEARRVGTAGPVETNTLSKICICNTQYKYQRHPGWSGSTPTHIGVCSLDIKELSAPGDGCKKMSDDLHALFTAYHPFLRDVDLYFEGQPPLPSSFSPAVSGGESVSPGGGHHFDISMLDPCAYVLWMRIEMALTGGWGAIPHNRIWDHIAFCVS